MSDKENTAIDSAAIHAHITVLQAVIQRMAGNSSGAKNWCVTVVSAVVVVVADKEKPQLLWIAAIPALMFMVVDAYYLGLERGFRKSYNDFIDALQSKTIRPSSLYAVELSGQVPMLTASALWSFSVLPFYGTLLVLLLLTRIYLFS